MTATAPPLSERDFMAQVTQLATIRGWYQLHLRPAMTRDSWRTPISGDLGKGWPDLFLARPRDCRVMVIELKSDTGKVSPEQEAVLEILSASGLEAHLFRPRDWATIEAVLR